MTSIASLPISTQVITAGAASPVHLDSKPVNPTSKSIGGPATIVSFSAKAVAASAPAQKLPTLDPDKVSNALAEVSGANGLAFLDAHLDLSLVTAKFGAAFAAGIRQGTLNTEYTFANVATSNATSAGIPFQSSVKSVDDLNAYAASGSSSPIISVADFSFKSGGSTYSITNQSDGTLLGTKDGQAWQTWQLAPINSKTNFGNTSKSSAATSDAVNALQTLTSLNNHTSSKALTPLDLSA